MAREVIYKCDLPSCTEVRKETNHWFVVLEFFNDDGDVEYHISKFSPREFTDYESIFCGEAHTLRFIAGMLQDMQKMNTPVQARCVHCNLLIEWDAIDEAWIHKFPNGNSSYSCSFALDDESLKGKFATPPAQISLDKTKDTLDVVPGEPAVLEETSVVIEETKKEPLLCLHCGLPIEYDFGVSSWRHSKTELTLATFYSCNFATRNDGYGSKSATPPEGTPIPQEA